MLPVMGGLLRMPSGRFLRCLDWTMTGLNGFLEIRVVWPASVHVRHLTKQWCHVTWT